MTESHGTTDVNTYLDWTFWISLTANNNRRPGVLVEIQCDLICVKNMKNQLIPYLKQFY